MQERMARTIAMPISIGMLPGGEDCRQRQGRGLNCLKRCSSEPLNIVPTGQWQLLLHSIVLLPSQFLAIRRP